MVNFHVIFYFGNRTSAKIKKLNYSDFEKAPVELPFKTIWGNFYILKGQYALAFKKYKYYIITGQPFNISSWLLLVLNKLKGKKTFIWNHGWYGNESAIKKLLKKNSIQP